MKFSLFSKLYSEAIEYDNVDMYIADRGWQDWMDNYVADKSAAFVDTTKIAAILNNIYDLAHMDIGQIRSETKLSAKDFSNLFRIPARTVQSWVHQERRTPDYALILISYAVFMEGMDDEQN